jgi:hypothetical protein
MSRCRPIAAAAALTAGLILGGVAPAFAATSTGNHASYIWVIGATTPADTAMAPDGGTISLAGVGTLQGGPGGSASGGGTFTTSSGGSGHWSADDAQGFVTYGSAGPDFPPGFTGGQAKLKVTLSDGATGVLTITCVLGSPPAGMMEGITLVLGTGVSGEYTKKVEGNNIFIAQ